MSTIAGHDLSTGRCSCGLTWTDIRNATEDDIGAEGIAHYGKLSVTELEQIQVYRRIEDERIADAMAAVAAGAGR